MLTIFYELFCRILSKSQQFLALLQTLRKILIFFTGKLVSKRLNYHMCVLVRPFIRRTFIVAGEQFQDRFPLKAQVLDFSGFDDERHVFQSFILDASYANDSQVCTTIAGKTFLPIKSFSCGHEVCDASVPQSPPTKNLLRSIIVSSSCINWQLSLWMILHWIRHKDEAPFLVKFFHAARGFDESFCEKKASDSAFFFGTKQETSLNRTWSRGSLSAISTNFT